jgi:drug/metabolite transporter (DMT)-like permease
MPLGATAQVAANRRGILFISAAMACLVSNDALMKYVGQTMPLAQLIFLRGLIATVLVLAVAHMLGATARIGDAVSGPVAVRALMDATGSLLYLWSLLYLPIGNATAINLAAPIFMTFFATMFMQEKAGLQRWLSIGLGFVGVVLIVQPRADGFNGYALICLLATLFQAGRELLTRRIDTRVPSIVVAFASVMAVCLIAGAISVIQGWRPLGWFELSLLALAASLLATGYYFVVNSMRHGELAVVAPFRYTGLLFAVVIGYVVWGDVPNLVAWCAILLLFAVGLYMLHSERLPGRRRRS